MNLFKNTGMKLMQTLLVGTFIFLSLNSFAQDFREKLNFGLKAGVNFANVYDSEGEDFVADFKTGFAGGAFVTIPLGRFLGIQPEIMFSQKGMKASGSFGLVDYSVKSTKSYIDIPLLLAIRPADFISILVGPQFAFQVASKDKFELGNVSSENSSTESFDDLNIRKNMFGAHLGLDINIKHFVISPRAALDFQDNKGDGSSFRPRYKNYYLQLTVGYRF